MRLVLRTAAQQGDNPPESRDTALYVRRSWGVFAVYCIGTSLVVAFGLGVMMLLFAVFDNDSKHGKHKPMPPHAALIFAAGVFGVASVIAFVIQLIAGPFVFTKDVVCRQCHRRFEARRIAFFTGKYSRPPRCECGGKIEPAFLWKPDISSDAASLQSSGM